MLVEELQSCRGRRDGRVDGDDAESSALLIGLTIPDLTGHPFVQVVATPGFCRPNGNLAHVLIAAQQDEPADLPLPQRGQRGPARSDLVFGFHHDLFDRFQSASILGRFGFPPLGTPN